MRLQTNLISSMRLFIYNKQNNQNSFPEMYNLHTPGHLLFCKLDGRIHFGKALMTGGGVGRNICESLTKLGCNPSFISVLGKDPQGTLLKNYISAQNLRNVEVAEGANTAMCTLVLDKRGDCKFLVGDMSIHSRITPEMIVANQETLKKAPLIIFDANLSLPAIDTILDIALENQIPVFFEPTDVEVSIKPFQSKKWRAIKFITPNLAELRFLASYFSIKTEQKGDDKIKEIIDIVTKLVDYIDNILVTLGAEGLVVARRGKPNEPFLKSSAPNRKIEIRHYVGNKDKEVINTTGAGDNLASGIMAGILKGLSEEQCVAVGLAAAEKAISVTEAVPEKLFDANDDVWGRKAPYLTLY